MIRQKQSVHTRRCVVFVFGVFSGGKGDIWLAIFGRFFLTKKVLPFGKVSGHDQWSWLKCLELKYSLFFCYDCFMGNS